MKVPLPAPPVRRLALDSFQPETLDAAVSGGALDHVQLRTGHFLGELLHAELDDRVFDYGAYNLPLLASGGMPGERVVLGFVASDGGEGNLNGTPLTDDAIVVLAEGSELHYRLAPHTRIECGFFHLGRFSTNYAKLYGESPSATLRCAGGPAARKSGALRAESGGQPRASA